MRDAEGSAGSTGTRLNQIPADGGGGQPAVGQPDLASSPTQKRAAAQAIQDHIEPDTTDAGNSADTVSQEVVKAFGPKDGHGWLMSKGMAKAQAVWGDQVRNLVRRLSSEKDALRGSNATLTGTDASVRSGVRASSSLDSF
ncbi:hypothetical protein ABR738_19020 [Streptomyces sp. Edi4]|uniref:hypothetical protein n=1 Tax=Streptomyces sp. Edi4 TaxID=3162527 RepID=UPI003305E68B